MVEKERVVPSGPRSKAELDEIRRMGEQFLGQLVSWWASLEDGTVHPRPVPADFQPLRERVFPPEGDGIEQILADLENYLVPGLTRVASPRYLGMMNPPPALPGVFAEMLSAAFNQNCSLWNQSPGGVELEKALVAEMCGLAGMRGPRPFGVLVSGGSMANIMALKLARGRALGWETRRTGLSGVERPMGVYASGELHYSFEKGMDILGLGVDRLRQASVDGRFRVRPDAMRRLIAEDRDKGIVPGCVIGIAGTTNTGSIDPLDELADLAREFGAWFHVDAAYGGAGLLVPELLDRFRGIERVDSLTMDPHKWFFVPFECAALLVNDAANLRRAFSVVGTGEAALPRDPESPDDEPAVPHYYLEQVADDPEKVDYFEFGPQGSRSFKALKLWVTFRALGKKFYKETVARNVSFASRLHAELSRMEGVEMFHKPELGILCFRCRPAGLNPGELDALNRRIHELIDREGRFWISRTRLRNGALVLRVNFQNYRTREEDFRELVDMLQRVFRMEELREAPVNEPHGRKNS